MRDREVSREDEVQVGSIARRVKNAQQMHRILAILLVLVYYVGRVACSEEIEAMIEKVRVQYSKHLKSIHKEDPKRRNTYMPVKQVIEIETEGKSNREKNYITLYPKHRMISVLIEDMPREDYIVVLNILEELQFLFSRQFGFVVLCLRIEDVVPYMKTEMNSTPLPLTTVFKQCIKVFGALPMYVMRTCPTNLDEKLVDIFGLEATPPSQHEDFTGWSPSTLEYLNTYCFLSRYPSTDTQNMSVVDICLFRETDYIKNHLIDTLAEIGLESVYNIYLWEVQIPYKSLSSIWWLLVHPGVSYVYLGSIEAASLYINAMEVSVLIIAKEKMCPQTHPLYTIEAMHYPNGSDTSPVKLVFMNIGKIHYIGRHEKNRVADFMFNSPTFSEDHREWIINVVEYVVSYDKYITKHIYYPLHINVYIDEYSTNQYVKEFCEGSHVPTLDNKSSDPATSAIWIIHKIKLVQREYSHIQINFHEKLENKYDSRRQLFMESNESGSWNLVLDTSSRHLKRDLFHMKKAILCIGSDGAVGPIWAKEVYIRAANYKSVQVTTSNIEEILQTFEGDCFIMNHLELDYITAALSTPQELLQSLIPIRFVSLKFYWSKNASIGSSGMINWIVDKCILSGSFHPDDPKQNTTEPRLEVAYHNIAEDLNFLNLHSLHPYNLLIKGWTDEWTMKVWEALEADTSIKISKIIFK